MKVAFFQDGSIESPNTHGQPAFLGLKLALGQAIESGTLPVLPELVGFDTEGDPQVAAELAAEVADDPTYVAAVAAPFWEDVGPVASVFEAEGIPVLSLSGAPSPGGSWFRMVAGGRQQAEAIAAYAQGARGTGVCLAGDGSPYSQGMNDRVGPELRGSLRATVTAAPASGQATAAARTIEGSGCSTVIWTGFGTGAGELRDALSAGEEAGRHIAGVDAMKDPVFLELAGGQAEGTVAMCACVDLTTSTDAAAQRFVHDFQADYATPPGIYAAEGWDAGSILLRAFEAGAATPEAVEASILQGDELSGLAGTYRLGGPPTTSVHLFRVAGGRWVPVGGTAVALPLRTEGVLAVGSCRVGAPHAYRDPSGRLVGFDVELARAIARRLDLALGWTRTSCGAGTAPVDDGHVDVLLVPADRVVPGTPSSGVVFSTRAALVVPAREVGRDGHAPRPGPGDLVGVAADDGPVARWARGALAQDGAEIRVIRGGADRAYGLLERGRLTAVADSEAAAWAAIEHRPALLVGATHDIGADDVMVASSSATDLLAAVDGALAELVREGTYALLFAKYFPGATLPAAVGT